MCTFSSCPEESRGIVDLGLWYLNSSELNLISYLNADFIRCKVDRKITSGTRHFLGSLLIF
jgi:hypothetical protein